jgi:hypothetical protein
MARGISKGNGHGNSPNFCFEIGMARTVYSLLPGYFKARGDDDMVGG